MAQEKSQYVPPTLTKWHLNVNPVSWTPPYDLFEDEESYLARVEIAGMKREHFLIWMDDKSLSITGERPPADIPNALHGGIVYGHFKIEIPLLQTIDEQNVEANYQNGFLNVYLPKK
jgi:HSP20 family protein